jgi:hypothetical protein
MEAVGTVRDGSVIEVFDCKDADIFRLTSGAGYVLKHIVGPSQYGGGEWVKVKSNRYNSCRNEDSGRIPMSSQTDARSNINKLDLRNEIRLTLLVEIIHIVVEIDKLRKSSEDYKARGGRIVHLQIEMFRAFGSLLELVGDDTLLIIVS